MTSFTAPEVDVVEEDDWESLDEGTQLPIKEDDNNDYAFPFNGLRPDGEQLHIDVLPFVLWASLYHPEYLDREKSTLAVDSFVLSEKDCTDTGLLPVESFVGSVLVTVRPNKGDTTWPQAAQRAAAEWEDRDPMAAARFRALADMFTANGFVDPFKEN